jgi:hypothetical protein
VTAPSRKTAKTSGLPGKASAPVRSAIASAGCRRSALPRTPRGCRAPSPRGCRAPSPRARRQRERHGEDAVAGGVMGSDWVGVGLTVMHVARRAPAVSSTRASRTPATRLTRTSAGSRRACVALTRPRVRTAQQCRGQERAGAANALFTRYGAKGTPAVLVGPTGGQPDRSNTGTAATRSRCRSRRVAGITRRLGGSLVGSGIHPKPRVQGSRRGARSR